MRTRYSFLMRSFIFVFILFIFLLPSLALSEYSIFEDTSWADVPAIEPSYDSFSQQLYEALIPFLSSSESFDGVITDVSVMPIYTPDNSTTTISSGLSSIMRSIIGNYSPVVVQYQYNNGTNTAYLREIFPDYEWMFNFSLFSLVLYCVFRMGGSLLWNR